MKRTFCALAAIAALTMASSVKAQEKNDSTIAPKKHHSVTISINGMQVKETVDSTAKADATSKAKKEEKSRWKMSYGMVDLGLNSLRDNTNYQDPGVQAYLAGVPAGKRNSGLFDLRTGKSVNVNVYPWMMSYKALKTHGQRIYLSTGIGLQLYNFRYEEPLTYTKTPGVFIDTISFKKNKLGLDYLNVPLMVTFKTRLHKDTWLVYGVGITEGYRLASWTKQVSDGRGKVKVHDAFGLADFNTCITAEFGIDNVFRLYASYQVTSLYSSNGIDQHPVSIGFRFSGM